MLKTFKFSGEESNFFVVADFHYRHNRDFIYTKRKNPLTNKVYENVDEHDSGGVAGWNSVCTNSSVVCHIGDLIFNDPTGAEFTNLLRKLNFQILYLFWGNHNSGQRQNYIRALKDQHPNAVVTSGGHEEIIYEVYPLIVPLDGNPHKSIVFLPQYCEFYINSTHLVLFHYPIISHNHLGHGTYHLCGHSHGSCIFTNKDKGVGRRLDVGLESFGRPISLKEVKYHLRDRTLDSFDHHNEKTT